MDERKKGEGNGLFRCGFPAGNLQLWLAQNGRERLRIATYGLSTFRCFGHYLLNDALPELIVGVSGIDPMLILDLHGEPVRERWQRLLSRCDYESRKNLLRTLRKASGWHKAGATVRLALPGRSHGLMHLKMYLGQDAALIGSANFTSRGLLGDDQHELLLEVRGATICQLRTWWEASWASAWPIEGAMQLSKTVADLEITGKHSAPKGYFMNSGPKTLLGYWLGEWGAWALNGNGVVSYPHQLQAVEWIKPEGKAYLLGDEVGLGKTFTAALIWKRHQQLYGEKARLVYITRPSLIVDAISAFVSVLGVDEFLRTTIDLPLKANDVRPNFSIFHAGTSCWEMVADETGRKKNRDNQVAILLSEGRYRIRPDAFVEKLQWLRAFAAKKVHEQITISAVSRLMDTVYSFVSIDTLRNPENPIANVFDKIRQSSLIPLVIVDESHGLGRYTKRRTAIADLVWGPREFHGNAILNSTGALVVYMTGTPVHPNPSETASRLGLLDVSTERTPHKPSNYDNLDSAITRDILNAVRERAVIRRKEGITLDGTPDGAPLFPKRLVFPFQKWSLPTDRQETAKLPDVTTNANKDYLMAIDQYVAREASHGAKLVSLIRQILRSARDWPEIKQLVKDGEARKNENSQNSFGEAAYDLAESNTESTVGDQRKRWESLRLGLKAAQIYEEKLLDPRLENLTWKLGRDEKGDEEKQMLFTKVGWKATAYDSLAKGGRRATDDEEEFGSADLPDEDEETAGEPIGPFDSPDEMLKSAQRAKRLADEYLNPIRLDDDSKVRFSMLVALLEDIAKLKLWEKSYESMADEDRFGWGVADDAEGSLKACLAQDHSQLKLRDPWVVHARYIHSVVDTAVRLQLRYGQEDGKPIVGIIIGDTPNHRRDQIKDEFSKGKIDIVCMSDAGAEGINLQRSNRIVLLDVPVSPGRIEQIAGRVHRLGSTRAAQVTLLLPPGNFGTKVFEALRKAASSVFKMAVGGSNFPAKPIPGTDESYYLRQLADYEARLLTAVAETSGAIRSEDNRIALEEVVAEPELNGQPNTKPIEPLFQTGFRLLREQRERFKDESVATQSSLLPEVQDLVDALVKGANARTSPSLMNFRIPIAIINDREHPENYGDLVTREQPFHNIDFGNGQRYWYGPQRFLPADSPQEKGFKWLGVVGNRAVSALLTEWRQERQGPINTNAQPQTWISSAIPRGKALAFCGITNIYKPDGNPATAPGDKTLHVMLGFADYPDQGSVQWRPFLARGATVSRATVEGNTWLGEIVPNGDKRWAATMIRKVTGLEPNCSIRESTLEDTRIAKEARDSAIKEMVDEDENTISWRLQKENVKVWLDKNTPTWWAGGPRLGCKPEFFLMVFGA